MANQQPTPEQLQSLARQNAQFLAKVWSDPAFKQRLMSDPKAVLAELGSPLPEDIRVHVVEDTDTVRHVVLPPRPSQEVSDEQLEAVAGGASIGTGGSASTFGSLSCPANTLSSFLTAGTGGTFG